MDGGMDDLERQLADLEALDQIRARESFLAFYMRMTGFEPPPHVKVIAKLLQAMERDVVDRGMIFAPPRHAKTLLASTLFPAWLLGRYPASKMMSVVHTERYAGKIGRAVRNLMKNPHWPFHEVTLARDSQAKDQWMTPYGGEYNAFGATGGNQHGNPAEWLFMDDLVKGRAVAMSPHMRDEIWEIYRTDLLSRLEGRAKQLMVFCLTGDTPVHMADGTLRPIVEVSPGEKVLTRTEDGRLSRARVTHAVPQGEDRILRITTGSSTVRANGRHPFLVDGCDGLEWVRADSLRTGDRIVHVAPDEMQPRADVTRDEAFALGYMFADGWVTVRDTVQKSVPQYKTNGGELRTYAPKIYPRRGYVTCVAATKGNDRKSEARTRTLGILSSKFHVKWKETRFGYARTDKAGIGRWLQEHGLVGTAKTKRLPAWLFGQNTDIRSAFLNGCAVADGCVTERVGDQGHGNANGGYRATTIALSNRGLTEDMRHLARGLGYRVTNISAGSGEIQPPNSPGPAISERCSFRFHHDQRAPGFTTRPITSISDAGRARVYDLTIEGTENFFVDGMCCHNTRWHEDDPAGRILPEGFNGSTGWYRDRETGEKWYVLSLPALSEHDNDPLGRAKGEWLWPERFGEDRLGAIRKRGGWVWGALFQQRPSPEEGLLFKQEHIQYYEPSTLDMTTLTTYIASDYAVTEEAGAPDPDYTVHQVWGVDADYNIYLLDMWRGRTTSDVWVNEWLRLVQKWKPLRAFEEGGQIIKGIGPFLSREMQRKNIYCNRVQLASSTSKEQRAQSLLGLASMGKMFLPARKGLTKDQFSNFDAFEKELLSFPTAKHDDCVDPATLFARGIDRIAAGRPVAPKHSPQNETLDDLWSRYGR